MAAILNGIQRGRVFIDLTGSRDKVIDLGARDSTEHDGADQQWTSMGDTIHAAAGDSVTVRVQVVACPRAVIHLFLDGHETPALPPLTTGIGNETLPFSWISDGNSHWIRAEVRDANGSLMLISNPIYINFEAH